MAKVEPMQLTDAERVFNNPLLMAAKAEIEATADWVQHPYGRRIQQRTLEVVARHLEARVFDKEEG